ncbi:MAG: DNA mismatch repair endonuclease MutL [Rhodothermaceae bacterium]
MSNKIKILPENISNKIAAGEVVQRPESVLKELLENAIDAGADSIDVIIKGAGKSLIQIVDNGKGMSPEDAVLSVQRHATSKISNVSDLDSISTFGFRGEALSSISAVSKFELKTKTKADELGTIIKFEDDNIILRENTSCATGTSVAVKNLFYNTPARRKFLKSNATELKHIIETFKRIALSYPVINFRFYNDDDLLYDLTAGSLEKRMESLFADTIMDAVVEVDQPTDFITVRGYISKPTFVKKNRGDQYLFVNNRYVRNKVINHAVFSAYENILLKGEYPFFVLFIEIDPEKFDINVHPQKLEIKFDDDKGIYSIIYAIIKRSLGSYDFVPSVTFSENDDANVQIAKDRFVDTPHKDFSDRPTFVKHHKSESNGAFSDSEIDMLFNSINPEIKSNVAATAAAHPFESEPKEIYHTDYGSKTDSAGGVETSFIVGLHNKYILSQIKSGLMIIDIHVAHERILYEKALQSFSANMPFSQQLLFSQTLTVDAGDYALLVELESHLAKLGFALKFNPKNEIVINGVPSDVKVGSEIDTLLGIVEEYKDNQIKKELEQRDNLAKSFACRTAIKAGDKLSEKEMRLLVDQLFATSMPYVCPHGRPVVIKISLEEFDKRFGRL